MSDVEVDVTDNSQQVSDDLNGRIPIILEACGLEAEKHGKRGARVDTGRYRASITHAVSGNEESEKTYRDDEGNMFRETVRAVPESEHSVYVGTNVEYALVLENLDHTIKNSIANHLSTYKKIIKDGMKRE